MAGSVVSSNPAQMALRTATLSSLPETIIIIKIKITEQIHALEQIIRSVMSFLKPLYCLLFITRVGNIVTSPRVPLPI